MYFDEEPKLDKNSYDFIMNTGTPEQPPLFDRINKVRIVLAFFALALFVIIVVSAFSILSERQNQSQIEKMITVEQTQTEVIRIASLGASSTNTNSSERSKAIMEGVSQALETTKELTANRGGGATDEELRAKEDTSAESTLDNAKKYGTYEKSFDKLINNKLVDYQQALLAAEKKSSKTEHDQFEKFYKDVDAMLGLVDNL